MPILTQDIKLLKSAVMADTTDGGGQMTGVQVIDGQSNNMFPDTSAMDRAFGRVNIRKVFGVAHTTDTDTLLGAHAVITDAPDDPLVHCTLIKTAGWADERDAFKTAIEQYLVKGPKASVRIYDTHYAGSLQLRLISIGTTGGAFPAGGDALVLRTPNGTEQFVRVLRISSMTNTTVAVSEGNTVNMVGATVATCDLGQALTMDVLGPPAVRVFNANGVGPETSYAMLYTTSLAAGARFYGVKPLGVPGVTGDLSVTTDGGIYTPVVPAATIETPIIDQYPMTDRTSVVTVGYAPITLPAISMAIGPNAVVRAPTPIAPTTVALTAGGTSFTDDGAGALLQGTANVGSVDYAAGKITFSSSAPSYGTVATTLTYKAGTLATGASHTAAYSVTLSNVGLSYTQVFQPPPARGSFALDFMAQGRWYTLSDNGNGKLSGSEQGYGTGTINYSTGSVSVTLGAIPDVGSKLIASWGNAANGVAADPASLPTKVTAGMALSSPIDPSTAVITWANGATNYTATANASGVLSGDATGNVYAGSVVIAPNVFPSGAFTVTSKHITTPVARTGIVRSSGLVYTLTHAPFNEGSLSLSVDYLFPVSPIDQNQYTYACGMYDRAGKVYIKAPAYDGGMELEAGTIDYTAGVITLYAQLTFTGSVDVWNPPSPANAWNMAGYYTRGVGTVLLEAVEANLASCTYSTGAITTTTAQQDVTPTAWTAWLPIQGQPALPDSAVFRIGSDTYTIAGGVVRRGWNISSGAADMASAGSSTSGGQLSIASLPVGANSITWYNMALKASIPAVSRGVFRVASAPIKTGVFQLFSGASVSNGNDVGVISGSYITGTVDYARGIVEWVTQTWQHIDPATLSYNAVFLQYLPLDASLLGIETARLPLDGKVPIYRSGDLVVVHNTLTTTLPNPLTKGTVYDLGRVRLASVRVKTVTGVVVPDTLYTALLDPGTIMVPTGSDITAYPQPWTVEHRIEDMLLCSVADISGKLTFTRSLTHDFPADTSFVSSAMPFGDLFARVYSLFEQGTWTSVWQDTLIGSTIIAQFNAAQYPLVVTNAGAIKERWLILFTNTTSFRVIGESVGEIGTGNTASDCAPNNPATGVPYFSIPALGWGSGWGAGNCLRFNTDACGTPFGVVRTVLQGPASLDSDQFTLAFRGDVDRA